MYYCKRMVTDRNFFMTLEIQLRADREAAKSLILWSKMLIYFTKWYKYYHTKWCSSKKLS